MAKAELGTKRHCPNCGTRYYDLNRTPILCPKCGTVFDVGSAVRPEKVAKMAAVVADDPEVEDEVVDVELVSLEDADAETAGVEDVPDIEDEQIEDIGAEEDTFLEEDDDEGDDMTDIIGDVEDEEER
ncbi:TIGR02300 family protein [Pseudoxanthobacter soli DSM 19599]|uniref:TIGR02300 family protein n=1 Tax=Pseudoxanthobacter soli DSM 19599 TaxID=1123029 RepID=A0A1M7ZMP1_9HYPH|nr:TIGR02300 family protein [Pseudoxanthobacter soli]SHO66079.1 TIGR02300 family protein [Pseudoxanthobacter soli DSM 19599]